MCRACSHLLSTLKMLSSVRLRSGDFDPQHDATREIQGWPLKTRILACAALLSLVCCHAGAQTNAPIPWDQIGATAGANYQGDGLTVSVTASGARLHCVFQRLDGEATREGLWLTSTVPDQPNDRFRVTAIAVGRESITTRPTGLPSDGLISLAGQTVRFARHGLIEEYSVSMDGVRQDFVVLEKPGGASVPASRLVVELAVTGATVEKTVHGVQLVLAQSGRRIAYGRLRVTDATGRELPARMEVDVAVDIEGENGGARPSRRYVAMAVVVDDTDAIYPVRIDPTFSDANWVSMGGLPGTDGIVRAAVVDGFGHLYIGGSFTIVGDVLATNIAKRNGSNWSSVGAGIGGSGANGNPSVYALTSSGTNLYVGGDFTTAGGIAASSIAKWDGSSWSALGSGMASGTHQVFSLAMSGSLLYAGGFFGTAGGSTVNYIAKWDGTNWSALGSGMNNGVYALAVSGSNVYAGGVFTLAGGSTVNRVAKWDGNSWSALGSGLNNTVHALAVSGSNLYAGGTFTWDGCNSIARWDGSNWNALGSGVNGAEPRVQALAVSGSDLYVGGTFSLAGGNAADYIAKWDGSNWSGWGSAVNNWVYALAVSGSDVYVGGGFIWAGGNAANNIAKWDGNSWRALGLGMGGVSPFVNALEVLGSDVYVGGNFTMSSGSVANRIAKWDGGSWSALGSEVNNTVKALAVAGSNLYAGGFFTAAGGIPVNYIAKWDGSSWSALGAGMNGAVYALAVAGSNLFAGGSFTNAGGDPANRIAKWDGSSWSTLGLGLNNPVRVLAVSGGDLYAGGDFTTATNSGGLAIQVNRIAKWNGTSWSALGSGMNDSVWALTVSGSNLYAGGRFTRATNSGVLAVVVNRVAKWDGSNWSGFGAGVNNWVYALAVSRSDLYVGGDFIWPGGSEAKYIAKWDGSSWSALGSGVGGVDPRVVALLVSGDDLYAGGGFTTAGGKVSAHVAKWAPLAFRANGVSVSNGHFQALLTGPDTNSVVVDSSADLNNWTPVVTNTLPPGGAWPISIPIGTNVHQIYRARLGP